MHQVNSKGFSLVEVLVSMVILAVALLGTAGLTASSLKNTNNSSYRSQATFLADDILDRMRANVKQARGGHYEINGGGPTKATSGSLEAFDCKEWLDELKKTLPDGIGTVTVVSATGTVTVEIFWEKIDENSYDNTLKTVSQL